MKALLIRTSGCLTGGRLINGLCCASVRNILYRYIYTYTLYINTYTHVHACTALHVYWRVRYRTAESTRLLVDSWLASTQLFYIQYTYTLSTIHVYTCTTIQKHTCTVYVYVHVHVHVRTCAGRACVWQANCNKTKTYVFDIIRTSETYVRSVYVRPKRTFGVYRTSQTYVRSVSYVSNVRSAYKRTFRIYTSSVCACASQHTWLNL